MRECARAPLCMVRVEGGGGGWRGGVGDEVGENNGHPWAICHIKNLIMKRKRNFWQFKKTNDIYYSNRYKIYGIKSLNTSARSKNILTSSVDYSLLNAMIPNYFGKLLNKLWTLDNLPAIFSQSSMIQTKVSNSSARTTRLGVDHNFQTGHKDVLRYLNVTKCGPRMLKKGTNIFALPLFNHIYCKIYNARGQATSSYNISNGPPP